MILIMNLNSYNLHESRRVLVYSVAIEAIFGAQNDIYVEITINMTIIWN
jgi:hypothetical protein